jgi:preprotein translocase subunit Sss1
VLNIIGLSLGFIGSVVSVIDIIFGNSLNDDWEGTKSKKYTKAGIVLIGLGFLLQLIYELTK